MIAWIGRDGRAYRGVCGELFIEVLREARSG